MLKGVDSLPASDSAAPFSVAHARSVTWLMRAELRRV